MVVENRHGRQITSRSSGIVRDESYLHGTTTRNINKNRKKLQTSSNTHKHAHGYIKKCLCISKLILDEIMQQSLNFLFIANIHRKKIYFCAEF